MNDFTVAVNGVTLGEDPYVITDAPTGLLSTPQIRVSDEPRPRAHGVIPGDDLLGGRALAVTVAVLGDSPADSEQHVTSLLTAFAPQPTETWLTARYAGQTGEYALFGRTRGADVRLDHVDTPIARCSFMATDPIRYAASESELDLTLSAGGGGLEYPVEYPVVYAGDVASSSGSAENVGSTPVHWSASIVGPIVNPRLALAGTGLFIRVQATLTAGQSVTLDSRTSSVFLGMAARPNWLAAGSRWFRLSPGVNGLSLVADGFDSGAGATVRWRSGWL